MSRSPYVAMGSNPIIHTDPNGDVLPAIAVAAIVGGAIGGVANVATNWKQIKQEGLWSGVKAFGVGAGAGALAGAGGAWLAPAAVGGSFSATVGSFAANGAVSGAIGGAFGGFGNSLALHNNGFGQALGDGALGGLLGAAGGAVLGAATGAGAHWLSGLKSTAGSTSTTTQVFDEFIDPHAVHSVTGGGTVVKQGGINSSITEGLTLSDDVVVTASRTSRKIYSDLIGHRAAHILNRHRFGANKPGKTEFPSTWNDDRILFEVNRIANDPNASGGVGKWNSPYKIGVSDGTRIRVDFYPNNHARFSGRVSTAYPYGN